MRSYRKPCWTEALAAAALVATTACHAGEGDAAPDAPASPACVEATTYQDLASIASKVFKQSCAPSGCHNGAASDVGRLNLREARAHASLVDVPSRLDPTRKLVVPGQPGQSFLLLMIGHLEPDEMSPPAAAIPSPPGVMPFGAGDRLLCVEKREAIARWIAAGAPRE